MHKQLELVNDFQKYYIPELCENSKMHVIAFTENCILAREVKGNKAHFIYTTSPDNLDSGMCFDFSLISDCNNNAHEIFTQLLTDLRMHLETVETETDYFQIIVNN